jgi:iron(III) transport system substrate-binding protein
MGLHGSLTVRIGTTMMCLFATGCGSPAAPSAPTQAPPAATAQPPAPPAAPTPAAKQEVSAPAAGTSYWDQVVEASKQERTLTVVTGPGSGPQKFLERFRERYPWADVQHTGLRPSDFSPRVLTEQRNGLYAWDYLVGSGLNAAGITLAPAGALGNIKELVNDLPAEIKDESKWHGGFEVYRDAQNPDSIITHLAVNGGFWVNRDLIPQADLTTVDQLLNSKFQGKLVIYNPSQPSGGAQNLAPILASRSEEFLEKLLVDQRMVTVDSKRQATEWFMTGRYPVGFGIDEEVVNEFKAQGIGTNVELILEPSTTQLAAFGITLMANVPHPNMAKLFLSWFLSQDGQDAWVSVGTPTGSSRRRDVQVHHADSSPDFSRLSEYKVWNGVPEGDVWVQKVVEVVNRKR